MTADQPLVTHADHADLTDARRWISNIPCHQEAASAQTRVLALMDRLIAHAEADKPALPEGWVVYADGVLGQRVFWHHAGDLYTRRDRTDCLHSHAEPIRHRLTPLVTAASLVPEGWHVDEDGDGRPTVWDADNLVILGRVARGADPLFDVLAALVTAAQAERGDSR